MENHPKFSDSLRKYVNRRHSDSEVPAPAALEHQEGHFVLSARGGVLKIYITTPHLSIEIQFSSTQIAKVVDELLNLESYLVQEDDNANV